MQEYLFSEFGLFRGRCEGTDVASNEGSKAVALCAVVTFLAVTVFCGVFPNFSGDEASRRKRAKRVVDTYRIFRPSAFRKKPVRIARELSKFPELRARSFLK